MRNSARGGSIRNIRRAALLAVLVLGLVGVGATPASAGALHVSGTAAFDDAVPCAVKGDDTDDVPENFFDYPALVMSGSLKGCWYTDVFTYKLFPNGFYLEVGQELFVGTVNDGPVGSFTTKYVFEAKLDAEGHEVSGQCQHPIVRGKDGLQGIKGLILFTDIVSPTEITYEYKGLVSV